MSSCAEVCNIDNGSSTVLILCLIIPTIIGIILSIGTQKLLYYLGLERGLAYYRAYTIIFISIILMIWFGIMSWGVFQYKEPCKTAGDWLNGDEGLTVGTFFVGMFANIVFGFIDNAGLFFGGCYLDEIFEKLPGGYDANVTAGYGNTFSDFLGSFLGTFCGLMIQNITQINEGPLYANSIGIVIGCLIGILIPKLILKKSKTLGLNKITSKEVFLGAMDKDELDALLDGKTLFDFRVERAFKKIDKNNSNSLCKQEIINYIKESIDGEIDDLHLEEDLKKWEERDVNNDNVYDLEEFKMIYRDMVRIQLRELFKSRRSIRSIRSQSRKSQQKNRDKETSIKNNEDVNIIKSEKEVGDIEEKPNQKDDEANKKGEDNKQFQFLYKILQNNFFIILINYIMGNQCLKCLDVDELNKEIFIEEGIVFDTENSLQFEIEKESLISEEKLFLQQKSLFHYFTKHYLKEMFDNFDLFNDQMKELKNKSKCKLYLEKNKFDKKMQGFWCEFIDQDNTTNKIHQYYIENRTCFTPAMITLFNMNMDLEINKKINDQLEEHEIVKIEKNENYVIFVIKQKTIKSFLNSSKYFFNVLIYKRNEINTYKRIITSVQLTELFKDQFFKQLSDQIDPQMITIMNIQEFIKEDNDYLITDSSKIDPLNQVGFKLAKGFMKKVFKKYAYDYKKQLVEFIINQKKKGLNQNLIWFNNDEKEIKKIIKENFKLINDSNMQIDKLSEEAKTLYLNKSMINSDLLNSDSLSDMQELQNSKNEFQIFDYTTKQNTANKIDSFHMSPIRLTEEQIQKKEHDDKIIKFFQQDQNQEEEKKETPFSIQNSEVFINKPKIENLIQDKKINEIDQQNEIKEKKQTEINLEIDDNQIKQDIKENKPEQQNNQQNDELINDKKQELQNQEQLQQNDQLEVQKKNNDMVIDKEEKKEQVIDLKDNQINSDNKLQDQNQIQRQNKNIENQQNNIINDEQNLSYQMVNEENQDISIKNENQLQSQKSNSSQENSQKQQHNDNFQNIEQPINNIINDSFLSNQIPSEKQVGHNIENKDDIDVQQFAQNFINNLIDNVIEKVSEPEKQFEIQKNEEKQHESTNLNSLENLELKEQQTRLQQDMNIIQEKEGSFEDIDN